MIVHQCPEDPARSDSAELLRVTDEDEFRVRAADHLDQFRQIVASSHASFVEDHDGAFAEDWDASFELGDELRQCLGAKAGFFSEDACSHRRWCETDRLVTALLPDGAGGIEC